MNGTGGTMELINELLANPWVHGGLYGLIILSVVMVICTWTIWYERKFSAVLQNRLGPNIVGPAGLLQPIADTIKMLRKEQVVPTNADPILFRLAPPLTLFLALATAAVVPFSPDVLVADLDIGVLWILSLSGLMIFPLWMAGWSSNNKYALLGSMRAVAQGLSYEVPLVLTALVPVVMTGSLSLSDIVQYQIEHGWFAFWPPGPGMVAFVVFFLASLAEANRIPFDIPEAESELVSGFTTEYGGMAYGLFPMTEYVHTLITSAVASALFLGGWDGPFFDGLFWMVLKTLGLFAFIFWLRWTLVRFRSDQLMHICWYYLVPVSVVLVALSALWVQLMGGMAHG